VSSPLTDSRYNTSQPVLMTTVVLVALNLRAVLSSLPTVASNIEETTGWSDATLGILTTIPVLCMGLIALAVPALAMHLGRKAVITFALLSLAFASLLRAIEGLPNLLFVSAILAGLGIALAGGIIPGIVREKLNQRLGLSTTLWTTALMGSAALGGALTVPLANALGSWSLALACWSIPAFVALGFWMYAERDTPDHDRPQSLVKIRELPWRNTLAWALAANMALNSIIFYSSLAWIAPSYADRGWSQETAGWLFGLFTASQVLSALTLTRLSARIKHRRTLFMGAILATILALFSIAWLPNFLPWLTLLILGFFLSGGFAMTLGLLSEYSSDAQSAARLTAMAFFVTYTTAAVGPFLAGFLLDLFNSWSMVFSILGCVALLQLPTVYWLKRGVRVA